MKQVLELVVYLVMLLAAVFLAGIAAYRTKRKAAFVGVFIAVFMALGTFTIPVMAIGVPANVSGDVYVQPTLHATISFYYNTTSAYTKGLSEIHMRTFNVKIGVDGVEVYFAGSLIKTFSYAELGYSRNKVGILSLDQRTPDDEYEENMKKAEYIDEWSSIEIAIDSEIFHDSNNTETQISGTKYIDIPNSTINANYTLLFDAAYTNNTGSNSLVYVVVANGTNTQEILLINGTWRNEESIWASWYNASLATLSGTQVIDKIKVVNLNFLHVHFYKMEAMVFDHRQIDMEINGISFAAYRNGLATVKTTYSTDPWVNKFVSYLVGTPSVGAANDDKTKTGAFGWENLDQLTDNLGSALFGSGYKTYSIDGYKIALDAGKTLQNKVADALEDAAEGGQAAQETVQQITNDIVKRVTLAVDVNSKALSDDLSSAQKTAVDVTNGMLAAISTSLGGTGEVVMNTINGVTKTVSDSVVGTVTQFTSGAMGVFTGISKWWQANWGYILLVLGFIIAMSIVGVFLYFYLQSPSGASKAASFGLR